MYGRPRKSTFDFDVTNQLLSEVEQCYPEQKDVVRKRKESLARSSSTEMVLQTASVLTRPLPVRPAEVKKAYMSALKSFPGGLYLSSIGAASTLIIKPPERHSEVQEAVSDELSDLDDEKNKETDHDYKTIDPSPTRLNQNSTSETARRCPVCVKEGRYRCARYNSFDYLRRRLRAFVARGKMTHEEMDQILEKAKLFGHDRVPWRTLTSSLGTPDDTSHMSVDQLLNLATSLAGLKRD